MSVVILNVGQVCCRVDLSRIKGARGAVRDVVFFGLGLHGAVADLDAIDDAAGTRSTGAAILGNRRIRGAQRSHNGSVIAGRRRVNGLAGVWRRAAPRRCGVLIDLGGWGGGTRSASASGVIDKHGLGAALGVDRATVDEARMGLGRLGRYRTQRQSNGAAEKLGMKTHRMTPLLNLVNLLNDRVGKQSPDHI